MSFGTWAALTVFIAVVICLSAARGTLARAGWGLAGAVSAYAALQVLEALAPRQPGTAATILVGVFGAGLGLTVYKLAGGQL